MATILSRKSGGSGGGGGAPSGPAGGSLAGTYPNPTIAAGSVDTAELAADAVENANIADDAVDTAQIADDAVDTAQIANGAVTAAKVAADVATQAELDAAGIAKGARVFNSVTIEIPDNTATNITFDSERFDNDGIHSAGVNPERLTCVTAGIYVIIGNVLWEANATGTRILTIALNAGATTLASDLKQVPSATSLRQSIATIYSLVAGDFVTLRAFQNSTAGLDVIASLNYSPEFSIVRVGALS